jgi:hypothetical protein
MPGYVITFFFHDAAVPSLKLLLEVFSNTRWPALVGSMKV